MSTNSIPILKKQKFTTFYFYNYFLTNVGQYYTESYPKTFLPIKFHLHDLDFFNDISGKYFIDPLALPLLLSLGERLKKIHGKPIELDLNIPILDNVKTFILQNRFIEAAGGNDQGTFIFDKKLIGASKVKVTKDHYVRKYELNNDFGHKIVFSPSNDVDQNEINRDNLQSSIIRFNENYFDDLLDKNENTFQSKSDYINIISEIITNGLFYSVSNVFAVMIVDQYNTKFSISDSGIGFEKSLKAKIDSEYTYGENIKLAENNKINSHYISSFQSIIEALYFSALKNRYGLIDLILDTILKKQGKVRIHSQYAQIILTSKLNDHLNNLYKVRSEYFKILKENKFNEKIDKYLNGELKLSKIKLCDLFSHFANFLINQINDDIRYSLIRFNQVGFDGVHIEVEIPFVERKNNI